MVLLKNMNVNYPELESLEADKNRGNVIIEKHLWISKQKNFIKNNDKHYSKANIYIYDLFINKVIKEIVNLYLDLI